MLHRLIDEGWTLDEVCYYDTGMEFPAIYEERDRTLPRFASCGIEYTERARSSQCDGTCSAVRCASRENGEVHKRGYGW